jgi:monoamine oxidase
VARTRQVDVVIVGAGLAGLTAARALEREGCEVVVLEAQPHVGGRVIGRPRGDGTWVDLGGQWVGRTHRHLRALADELDVARFPARRPGSTVLVHDGIRSTFAGDLPPFVGEPPPVDPTHLADARRILAELEAMAATVDVDAPWDAPGADTLDATTLDEWLTEHAETGFGRFAVSLMTRIGGAGAFEPGDVSLLHWLVTLRSAPQAADPEAELFAGGAAALPVRMAQSLTGRVVVNEPVRLIRRRPAGVEVISESEVHVAAAVIVAIAPPAVQRIDFQPSLPHARQQLLRSMPMGSLIKVQAIYERPYWRQHGLSGNALGDRPTIQFTADSSPPDSRSGILTGFVAGDRATELASWPQCDRHRGVVDDLVSYFGPDGAEVVELIEHDWSAEPWIGGAFTAHMRPGAWTSYGRTLRQPVGPIFWAGAETATRWAGFMEGAVRSGEDAAGSFLRSPLCRRARRPVATT